MAARVAPRRVLAAAPPVQAAPGEAVGCREPDRPPAEDVFVLVAGARAAAVNALLCALFAAEHRLPHTPRDTYLVVSGPSDEASLPGIDDVEGKQQPSLRRRPRRVDAVVADPLLDLFTIVAARAVTPRDRESGLVSELVDRSHCLVLVSDGRLAYQPAELDLLHAATVRKLPVFLVVTHVNETASWAEVVRANQAKLARNFQGLAMHPWYPVTRSRSGIPDLRRALVAWGIDHRRPASTAQRSPAIRVATDAATSGWSEVLHRELARAHAEAQRRAGARLRDVRPSRGTAWEDDPAGHPPSPGSDSPGSEGIQPAGPADLLERGLQALSLELARDLRRAVDHVLDQVLRRVLAAPPDATTLERTRVVLRRDVAERISGLPNCYRSLWVTRTAVVAVASSREPVAALAAHTEPDRGVLPPLGIGLTSNCLPHLQAQHVEWSPQAWIERAVSAVDLELTGELAHQFGHLHQAIADLVVEALDHDLLLV